MSELRHGFVFVDAGRTFTCHIEAARPPLAGDWWWFTVSTEQHQRYAPFRASYDDRCDDVQGRVVAYYEDRLARRAAPPATPWNRRQQANARAGTPAEVPALAGAEPTAAELSAVTAEFVPEAVVAPTAAAA